MSTTRRIRRAIERNQKKQKPLPDHLISSGVDWNQMKYNNVNPLEDLLDAFEGRYPYQPREVFKKQIINITPMKTENKDLIELARTLPISLNDLEPAYKYLLNDKNTDNNEIISILKKC